MSASLMDMKTGLEKSKMDGEIVDEKCEMGLGCVLVVRATVRLLELLKEDGDGSSIRGGNTVEDEGLVCLSSHDSSCGYTKRWSWRGYS